MFRGFCPEPLLSGGEARSPIFFSSRSSIIRMGFDLYTSGNGLGETFLQAEKRKHG